MVPAGNALGVISNPPQADHIPPLKISGIKRRSGFFRNEAIHVVCRVSEKPLQRSRWDFLRRHQGLKQSMLLNIILFLSMQVCNQVNFLLWKKNGQDRFQSCPFRLELFFMASQCSVEPSPRLSVESSKPAFVLVYASYICSTHARIIPLLFLEKPPFYFFKISFVSLIRFSAWPCIFSN